MDFTITQAADAKDLFKVGNKFSFDLDYNFDEYRSSLAAPDWDRPQPGRPVLGRTPATTLNSYNFNVE